MRFGAHHGPERPREPEPDLGERLLAKAVELHGEEIARNTRQWQRQPDFTPAYLAMLRGHESRLARCNRQQERAS
jgi:hypothetical protein